MPKKPSPQDDDTRRIAQEARMVLGDAYLAKRPSYKRALKRLERKDPALASEFDKESYLLLNQEIRRLEGLLREANVDTEKFEVERYTVNSWSKGNFQVKAHLKPKAAPGSLIAPPPYEAPVLDVHAMAQGHGLMEVLCIPDVHFGFLCDTVIGEDGAPALKWRTIHDEAAVRVVLEVARKFRPATIVILGDLLDLPAMSRWETQPMHKHQTLTAIQAAHDWLKKLRMACPTSRIIYIEGNHERRISDYLSKNAPELLWAVNVPGLLGLDKLTIEYVGPYGMRAELGKGMFATHGHLIGRKGGESSAKMLGEYHMSTVFGHTHRLELAFHTHYNEKNEGFTVFSMGCGTLAKLDGSVPGSQHPNWQQGFGAIWSGRRPNIYRIEAGSCFIEGLVLNATESA
jgi:predicted phosphodiesterase